MIKRTENIDLVFTFVGIFWFAASLTYCYCKIGINPTPIYLSRKLQFVLRNITVATNKTS